MTTPISNERPRLTALPAWRALATHAEQMRGVHLRTLFAEDPSRGERFAAEAAGLYLDYSKHRIAALHVALRAPIGASMLVDGTNVVPGVHEVLDRMATFAAQVRDGQWRGRALGSCRSSH